MYVIPISSLKKTVRLLFNSELLIDTNRVPSGVFRDIYKENVIYTILILDFHTAQSSEGDSSPITGVNVEVNDPPFEFRLSVLSNKVRVV